MMICGWCDNEETDGNEFDRNRGWMRDLD
jgi:hypothetical protein